MNPTEASEILKNIRNRYAKVLNANPDKDARQKAESEVAAINAGIDALEGQPVSQWISVKERLPAKAGCYLIDRPFVTAACFNGESFDHLEVAHWMPMPPPPAQVLTGK